MHMLNKNQIYLIIKENNKHIYIYIPTSNKNKQEKY